jgi:hypothetical protein
VRTTLTLTLPQLVTRVLPLFPRALLRRQPGHPPSSLPSFSELVFALGSFQIAAPPPLLAASEHLVHSPEVISPEIQISPISGFSAATEETGKLLLSGQSWSLIFDTNLRK